MKILDALVTFIFVRIGMDVRHESAQGRPMDRQRHLPLLDRAARAFRRFVAFAKSAMIGFFGTVLFATVIAAILLYSL